jgi:2,3,4,5-tetrahydropyridine-2-carboxylate N-succinyltransferase
MSSSATAYGFGIATSYKGELLDTYFFELGLGQLANQVAPNFDLHLAPPSEHEKIRGVERKPISIEISLDKSVSGVADGYLRLHLLSHRIVKPHGLCLDGIFAALTNVVWTSFGPCALENFSAVSQKLRSFYGSLTIFGVDKFPRMIDYVLPEGVRIADGDRVRLGAYLSPGTTVMHEGFVNFNAGTLGSSMVEGRISAGVVVGDGTDIGGSASIMGTLSGGGKEVISIGARCLLGANSGVGITLGDECVVESGLYITAGSKVSLPDGKKVKALELSGASGLLFRRNSLTGEIEALNRSGSWGGLNAILHKND